MRLAFRDSLRHIDAHVDATPNLTDPLALGHHRHRAQDEALFFHRTVREDVEDRLADVSRAFSDVTVISPFPQVWAGFGAALVPDGDILEFEPNSQDLIVTRSLPALGR